MGGLIVIDPKICHGKPVIAGPRTPASVILESLEGGDSIEELCEEYRADRRSYPCPT